MMSDPFVCMIISKMPCEMLVSVEIRISALKYTPVRPAEWMSDRTIKYLNKCNRGRYGDSPFIVLGVATGTNGNMKSINK